MQPAVRDFRQEERRAGKKDAREFTESPILASDGGKMMKDQDGDGRGERGVAEGESRGVRLNDRRRRSGLTLKRGGKGVAVFKAGEAGHAATQFRSSRTGAGSEFKKMIAKGDAGKNPGEQLILRDLPPEGGGAEPVLEAVHEASGYSIARRREWKNRRET